MLINYEKGLIIGDLHFPWQDSSAIELTLRIGAKLNPDLIVLNGDLTDCWEISRFDKSPVQMQKGRLAEELRLTRDFLKSLRKRFPKARIVYVFGNHEHRWSLYISSHAKELYGLIGLSLQEQLQLTDLNIDCVYSGNRESSWLYGKLLIGHFDLASMHSGYTAKNLLDRKGISLVQAHTHRGGSSFRRLWDRDIVAHEGFCLCDRSPAYVDHPNWQLGFLILYKDKQSDYFFVEPHPIAEVGSAKRVLKAYYNGVCYSN